jgi:hypothetical protein
MAKKPTPVLDASPAEIIDNEGGSTVLGRTLGYARARVGNWKQTGIPRKEWPHIIASTDGRVTQQMLESQARYIDAQKATAA